MSAPARELIVDLDAIAANTAVLAQRSASSGLMAVVKADAYGHGLVPSARAAQVGGATWLGVALLEEALALRAAGVEGPLLAWLLGVDDEWAEAINADIDLSVSARWALSAISDAATSEGRTARIHLKVDTGMQRVGAHPADVEGLVTRLDGHAPTLRLAGIFTHLAVADEHRDSKRFSLFVAGEPRQPKCCEVRFVVSVVQKIKPRTFY